MRRPFSVNPAHQLQPNSPLDSQTAAPSAIVLPKDQYLHKGAPTEWWWHTGTLNAGGHLYGFEINAASFQEFAFTQVMLTDVQNQKHYQETVILFPPDFRPDSWAESDPTKPWFANLAKVKMSAPVGADPAQEMNVTATLKDADTKTEITFDLNLVQQGPPLKVWGTGVTNPPKPPTVETNNYYYSLTRLKAGGSIKIGSNPSMDISGVTWMDHEYGLFENHGKTPSWILQDMQLGNGVCISNYSVDTPALNKRTDSVATVQRHTGETHFVKTHVTPKRAWKSDKSGKTYFVELLVELPDFNASISINSLMDSQEFHITKPLPLNVYEGVGTAKGTFEGEDVSGTAWIENTPDP